MGCDFEKISGHMVRRLTGESWRQGNTQWAVVMIQMGDGTDTSSESEHRKKLVCFEKVRNNGFDFSVHVSVFMCMMRGMEGGSTEEERRSRITPMFLVSWWGGGYGHTAEARRQSIPLGHVHSEESVSQVCMDRGQVDIEV